METNISFIPTERVTHFGQRQRHQGRQLQTFTETRSSTSTQRGQCKNDEARPSTSTQHNMYSSTQAGPSTSTRNEPTTFNKYNPISVNEYCMSLYQQIVSSTSLGQGFEGLHSLIYFTIIHIHMGSTTMNNMTHSSHHNLPNHPLMFMISARHQIHRHVLQTLR